MPGWATILCLTIAWEADLQAHRVSSEQQPYHAISAAGHTFPDNLYRFCSTQCIPASGIDVPQQMAPCTHLKCGLVMLRRHMIAQHLFVCGAKEGCAADVADV